MAVRYCWVIVLAHTASMKAKTQENGILKYFSISRPPVRILHNTNRNLFTMKEIILEFNRIVLFSIAKCKICVEVGIVPFFYNNTTSHIFIIQTDNTVRKCNDCLPK